MLREVILMTLILSASGLAGCIGPIGEDGLDAGAAQLSVDIEPSLDAWYTVDVATGPESPITAFWWTIPEGGVYKDSIFELFETSVVEVALLIPEGVRVDAFGLFAMVEHDGELAVLSEVVAVPWEYDFGLVNVVTMPDEGISTAPFHVAFGYDEVSVGDRIGFVFASRSETPDSYQLGIRPLDRDPGWDAASSSAASFQRATGGAEPRVLPVVATGAGFAARGHIDWSTGTIPVAMRGTTGDMVIEGGLVADARPFAAVRDQTFRMEETMPGWGTAMAIHFASEAVGQWGVTANMHGETLSDSGLVVQSMMGTGFATFILFGLPYFYVVGEGDIGSSVEMNLQTTAVSAGGFELIQLMQIDLGATMESLFGIPAAQQGFAWSGLVPTSATSAVRISPDGDVVAERVGGPTSTWLRVVPPAALDGASSDSLRAW